MLQLQFIVTSAAVHRIEYFSRSHNKIAKGCYPIKGHARLCALQGGQWCTDRKSTTTQKQNRRLHEWAGGFSTNPSQQQFLKFCNNLRFSKTLDFLLEMQKLIVAIFMVIKSHKCPCVVMRGLVCKMSLFFIWLFCHSIVAENDDIIPSFRANDNDDCSRSIGIEAT